eukprot:jgi/Botrbrau1/13640/Bobra.0373s0014.1
MFNVPILVKGGKDLAFPGVGLGEGSPVAGPVCPLGVGRSVSDDTLESMQPQQRSGSDLLEDSGDEDEPETSSPPPALPRAALSYSVRAQQLSCIICLEPFKDPFMTRCGHTFCHECLQRQLKERNQCPKCRGWLVAEHAYPNTLIQEVLLKATRIGPPSQQTAFQRFQAILDEEADRIGLEEINLMLQAVWDRKQYLEEQQKEFNLGLLTKFLQHAKEEKERQLKVLQEEVNILKTDLQTVTKSSRSQTVKLLTSPGTAANEGVSHAVAVRNNMPSASAKVECELTTGSCQESKGPDKAKGGDAPAGQKPAQASFQQLVSQVNAYRLWAAKKKAREPDNSNEKGESGESSQAVPPPAAADPPSPAGDSHCPRDEDASVSGSSASSTPEHSDSEDGVLSDSDMDENPRRRRQVQPKRKASQFEDLHRAYLSLRCPKRRPVAALDARSLAKNQADGLHLGSRVLERDALMGFGDVLKAQHCSSLEVVARLERRQQSTGAILSSIEFSKDTQLFATAGVKKTIALYDFEAVISNPSLDSHCPMKELRTLSKLSCLSWNKFVQRHLISSDYEGGVQLWDISHDCPVHEYEAHEKRIWSVDYCSTEHAHFVSGSDDCWVKTWDTRSSQAANQIYVKANVCSVKYNPTSHLEVAVGSADHNVHVFDIRVTTGPLHVFPGHGKAVSYVKYMDRSSLVSASTDSTLRLWDVPSQQLSRMYRSHLNEKNFVGLSVEGDLLACGSETGEVFVYQRHVSDSIAQLEFDPLARSGQDALAGPPFMTAVCWKPNSRYLLAANCAGLIHIMQLGSGKKNGRDWSRPAWD